MNTKPRKYPRVVKKTVSEESESVLTLSMAAAAGILVFTFVEGLLCGCVLRKRLG